MSEVGKANLDDIKAKYKEMVERQERRNAGGGDFEWFQSKEGKNTVRILPPKDAQSPLFINKKTHRSVGPKNIRVGCLGTISMPCPVCQLIGELRKEKTNESVALAKRMYASEYYYFNIIDRMEQDPTKVVKVATLPFGVANKILGLFANEEWGDISDPNTGVDIDIERKGVGINTEYPSVVPHRNSTPAVATPEDFARVVEKMIDLRLMMKFDTPENIVKIMLGESTSAGADASAATPTAPATTASTPATPPSPADPAPATPAAPTTPAPPARAPVQDPPPTTIPETPKAADPAAAAKAVEQQAKAAELKEKIRRAMEEAKKKPK